MCICVILDYNVQFVYKSVCCPTDKGKISILQLGG